ncbi:MAG: hypothetical protein BWX95_00034 [Bacteroidetes bacterium ADurb.Bin141]|nr:MAG: hypothetical protein BWX95_00034 [Bacteroidetes bacterium ADurb.Bin141]
MKYNLIDYPRWVERETYQLYSEKLYESLKTFSEVVAIYSIGHVSNPGISDIDLLILVKDNTVLSENFRAEMSTEEKYLFLHQPYACSVSDFKKTEMFTFLHNYHLVYGTDMRTGNELAENDKELLQKQTALEYLLKMYIQLYVQKKYRTIRVRDLLLHGKALIYDLEFLNIKDGKLYELILKIIDWRNNWFKTTPTAIEIINWVEHLFTELHTAFTTNNLFKEIYFPEIKTYQLSKNIRLKAGSQQFEVTQKGLILPFFHLVKSKKAVKLQNRFCSFQFNISTSKSEIPAIIEERFRIERQIRENGNKYLPFFLSMTSSLNLK